MLITWAFSLTQYKVESSSSKHSQRYLFIYNLCSFFDLYVHVIVNRHILKQFYSTNSRVYMLNLKTYSLYQNQHQWNKSVIYKWWCTQIYTIRPECIIRAVVSASTLFIIYIYVWISPSELIFCYPALLALTLFNLVFQCFSNWMELKICCF